MRPLDGITVVTLEHAVAAPFCTRQLADLGARVIKIERPGSGDFARAYDERVRGQASFFVWLNRSKESLTLDVKQPGAEQILAKLLQGADVLVQNLAPGAAARLGLSYEALRERHPGLIVCDISGYGSDGPYRDKKAYDLLIQSEAGFLSITGTPQEPVKAGCSIADISAGMYAYSNILAALMQRSRTGRGCRIDLSMLESMTEWMSHALYYSFDGARPPGRAGAAHATIYPYGPFPAGDGKTIMLGLQNEREWGAFCQHVLMQPELATDARFASNSKRTVARDALRPIIVETFAALTAEQVIERLEKAQIANAGALDADWLTRRTDSGAVATRCHRFFRAPHGSGAIIGATHRRYPRGDRLQRRRHSPPAGGGRYLTVAAGGRTRVPAKAVLELMEEICDG
jgi:itaconate CoA-transferase